MKILVITQNMGNYASAFYQYDFYTALSQQCECILWGPGFKGFSSDINLSQLLDMFRPTCIFFAHSYLPDAKGRPNSYNIYLSELSSLNIPKFAFLNKEYTMLEEKLSYFSQAKMSHIFSHHHNSELYASITKIPCTFIPFAADAGRFPSSRQKDIDIFFSGLLKNPLSDNNIRTRIQKKIFYTVGEFPLLKRVKFANKKVVWKNYFTSSLSKRLAKIFGTSERFNTQEYFNILTRSKSVINTFSPLNLIGTRYYETMASKAIVFCERGNYQNIFKDMHNAVMFNRSFDDFHEKLIFSISDSNERKRIVENAYEDFITKHTWEQRAKTVISIMEGYHG